MRHVFLLIMMLASTLAASGQRLVSHRKDLAVKVEITGRSKGPEWMCTGPLFHAKISVQNMTSTPRKVIIMACSWYDSWFIKGNYFFCWDGVCDSNHPISVLIPAGQSLLFYTMLSRGPLARRIVSSTGVSAGNRLGFADFKYDEFSDLPGSTAVIYWSNDFTEDIKKSLPHRKDPNSGNYRLSKTGK